MYFNMNAESHVLHASANDVGMRSGQARASVDETCNARYHWGPRDCHDASGRCYRRQDDEQLALCAGDTAIAYMQTKHPDKAMDKSLLNFATKVGERISRMEERMTSLESSASGMGRPRCWRPFDAWRRGGRREAAARLHLHRNTQHPQRQRRPRDGRNHKQDDFAT